MIIWTVFYSMINDKHTENVWNTFNLEIMGQYHDLYLKSDILLLSDVFENFRKMCVQYYKLDPCQYFTWDGMLKMTNIKLESMTNINMFQFVEKGSNKYMKKYDEKAAFKYTTHLDANNLYGRATRKFLPTGSFRLLREVEIDKLDWTKCTENSKKGLILEVDLEYPKKLHDFITSIL